MATVDFIYGLGSRYSYLAASQLDRITRQTGATFLWRAIDSSVLTSRRRHDPFAPGGDGQYDWAYRRRDAEAWAAFYGVPYREPVGRLDYPRGLAPLAARAAGRQGAIEAMSRCIFGLIFIDDRASFGREDLIEAAEGLGLDVTRFARDLDDPALAREHEDDIARAAAQGAFGVPTFVLEDGRMFWGNDRLVLLEAALKGRL